MKKTIRRAFLSMISLLLTLTFVFTMTSGAFGSRAEDIHAKVRTVELTSESNANLSHFDKYDIIEDEETPAFMGTTICDNTSVSEFFDNVSLDDYTDEITLSYNCQFDMNTLQFFLKITATDCEGSVIAQDEIITDAFVTENGGLDAYLDFDGETYLLSELYNGMQIDECSVGSVLAAIGKVAAKVVVPAVAVYVVVAETAEQIKARSNYQYNKDLEASGNGVSLNNYIYRQNETNRPGYKSGNYRFGFTSFSGTGCAVASVYNMLINSGKAEMLSTTIFNFEKWAIEFAVAWGNFGANPYDLTRYFNKYDITYKQYLTYSGFKKALDKKSSCKVIMSSWNNGGMLKSIFSGQGAHTYFFTKDSTSQFTAYDLSYTTTTKEAKAYSSIDSIYAEGGDFIVAYIIE